jgi:hypothetical protein
MMIATILDIGVAVAIAALAEIVHVEDVVIMRQSLT